ncbi:MAG: cache domain-containing protein, partial [Dehalococcoidales bacterium]|nr:cache domain-containing protein [Dehalococcoidales bacterium]
MPAYKINRIQLIVIVIAVAITLFGAFWYYRYESARISQEKYEDLHAFASLKIEQILNWKSERLTDAASLADNDLFTDMLDSWIREPDQQEKNYLDQLLRLEMERGYYNVLVYDESGNLLTSAKQDPDPLDDAVAVSFSRAASGGKPVLSDAYICPNGIVHLDAVAPVYGREGELVALVVMRSDAHSLLFPLLDSWPTPSDSAETLLARRDGEYALVINEARYAEEGPLSMRKPLSDTSNPAVQAVTGKEGRFEGFD